VRTADQRIIVGLYRARPRRDLLGAALQLGLSELDTAYSYSDFAAHALLAAIGPDITDRLKITTKIGFFPDGHDLTPARLAEAAHRIADDLGRAPDALLLHNPERSAPQFAAACEDLIRLRDAGLCGAWGISTWDPTDLLGLAAPDRPDVLMVRCGLTVPAHILAAGEQLAEQLRPREVRGMSPFGGSTSDAIWDRVDPTLFLDPASRDAAPTRIQATFAVAFAVPPLAAVSVGTSDAGHLHQLHAAAAKLRADPNTVRRYRTLLAERHTLAKTRPSMAEEVTTG
jgi:pyridoxine 4-dehydrogenase